MKYDVKVGIAFDAWIEIDAESPEQAEEQAREIIADRGEVIALYDSAGYVQEDVLEVE